MEHYSAYIRAQTSPEQEAARPHTHTFHEVFMLLEGKVDFFVEGTKFPLDTGDIVLCSAGDPHTKLVKNEKPYKCFVLYLDRDYFVQNGCPAYESVFTSHLYTEHKISAEIAVRSGFSDAFLRLSNYTAGFCNTGGAITNAVIIEMLHILNHNSEFSSNYIANPQVQEIIAFINESYRGPLTLECIANRFFMSKYYICKLFKKHTGYTVNSYITHKRINLVKALTRQGVSITAASAEAGFTDYSSFYKAFLKETGAPPAKTLKGWHA